MEVLASTCMSILGKRSRESQQPLARSEVGQGCHLEGRFLLVSKDSYSVKNMLMLGIYLSSSAMHRGWIGDLFEAHEEKSVAMAAAPYLCGINAAL